MTNSNTTTTYLQRKKEKKEVSVQNFRTEEIVGRYLKKFVLHGNKSKFINRALRLYIEFINQPERVMSELKRRYPDKWKHINRKRCN